MSKDKESICVTVRVRPLSNKQLDEDSRICLRVDEGLNLITITGNNTEKQSKDFYFDSVCDAITQNQMFERVGKRSTFYCMEGYNCTIFAYGQTGAGKTFTMMGINPESKDYFQQRGLIPRTLQHLFQCIEKQITQNGVDYMIKCSFVEIYNEQIIDLLGNGSSALNIRQDLKKGVYIQGVTQQAINQSQQAMEILRKGSKGRHVGSTYYNQTSSRSHSVFTMQIQSQQQCNGIKSTKSRHFHFIDLAGSERTKKSMGDRLKEGCSINKSLHVLSMVISSLAQVSQGKNRHVNYRDSKLTFLLKDSLGGNSKTHLIANISPSLISALETKSTLMFARKVKLIKVNKVSINEDASGNLQSLKSQIRRLKSQNLLLRNGGSVASILPNPYQPSQQQTTSLNTNSKMVTVLQQYVDEELQKQTKMQIQISRLQGKIQHLQKGIKHFSQNQKQLRMVIAIYEDKIRKLKNTEASMVKKYEQQCTEGNEKIQQIRKYFNQQRQMLQQQIQHLKPLACSSTVIKSLLRELKIFQQNPENSQSSQHHNLLTILSKNNNFLQDIKNSISQLEPEYQENKASKALVKANEQLNAKNQELMQMVEKYGLQIAQCRDKIQETQNLLSQAISNQISIQKKLENKQLQYQTIVSQRSVELEAQIKKSQSLQIKLQQQKSKQSQLQLLVSQSQLEASQCRSQLIQWKQKKQIEQSNNQERIQILVLQNQKLEEIVRRKVDQINRVKAQMVQNKKEFDKMKVDMEGILADASFRIQQLQQNLVKSQSQYNQLRSKLQSQKLTQQQTAQIVLNLTQSLSSQKQKASLLERQAKSLQKQMTKTQEQLSIWKDRHSQQVRLYNQQKAKWETNNAQLIHLVNEKRVGQSQAGEKLKQVQLELIKVNQRLSQLTIQYKNLTQDYKSLQSTSQSKISELASQLSQTTKELSIQSSQNQQSKQKMTKQTQMISSLTRQAKTLQQQCRYLEEQNKKMIHEMQMLAKKEKQGKIMNNQIKNEIYAAKKNYQVEINQLKDMLATKQEEIQQMCRDGASSKAKYEKMLVDLQKKMEIQFEIFKQNEGSIKKAMQTHLSNKQKKLVQIRQQLQEQQLNLSQSVKNLLKVQGQNQNLSSEIQHIKNKYSSLQSQVKQREESLRKQQQTLNKLQLQHMKVIEEMENRYNQESDVKNEEIDRLRRTIQQKEEKQKSLQDHVKALEALEGEISDLKSQLINRQAYCQQLQNSKKMILMDLQSLKTTGLQADNYVAQLQTQLKQKSIYITQLSQTQKTIQQSFTAQVVQKQRQINKIRKDLDTTKSELQTAQKNLANMNQAFNVQVRKHRETAGALEDQSSRLKDLIKKFQEQALSNNQQKQNLQQTINGLNFSITETSKRVSQLQRQQKSLKSENSSLLSMVKELELQHQQTVYNYGKSQQEIQSMRTLFNKQKQNCKRLQIQLREAVEIKYKLQGVCTELRILLDRGNKELQNLRAHIASIQNKVLIEQGILNQKIYRIQQQSARQLEKLTKINEDQLEKLQILKSNNQRSTQLQSHLKSNYQLRIQQLENQVRCQHSQIMNRQHQIANQRQKSEELQKFIDEQENKINSMQQTRDRIVEQLQEVRLESERRLKESQKRLQLGAAQMNSLRQEIKLIQDEASVWKQRMENLENQIRLSNDRAEKFRVEYIKQKQSNKQFKLLLDNAHCQIQSFRNQVMDKDKLYHQLLQKVSKNDIQRKGLLNNDKKFSDLLQKSRIQVNQMRKKYQDQLKINNILKVQLQKKDVDVSVVRQRSQQYCRKQQQLMQSIKADYSKIQSELKSTQNMLAQSKKALKKVTLKNEELQEQLQKINKQYIEVQNYNDQLKKQSLRAGIDQRQIGYVNKLKEENMQLKRQLQRAGEQLISANQDRLRLKSEMRHGKEMQHSSLQLNKKISQVKYLQKIIDDSVNVLGIKDYKKSVGDSLKSGIIDLQRQLAKSKVQLAQLNDDINLKNQRLQILENQKFKNLGIKDEEDTLTKMRNKIGRVASNFETIRHSKEFKDREEDNKSILQSKDQNKWGINR